MNYKTIKEALIPEAIDLIKNSDLKDQLDKRFNTLSVLKLRPLITEKLSWFLPTKDNFNILLNHLKDSASILDVGCGTAITGKYILRRYPNTPYLGIRATSMYGLDTIAYIDNSYIKEVNKYHMYLSPYNHDTLLLIWPPYATPLAYITLKDFITNPIRKKLIYVGELDNGCNGDIKFNELMETLLYETDNSKYKITIEEDWDRFPGLNDVLIVIEKK